VGTGWEPRGRLRCGGGDPTAARRLFGAQEQLVDGADDFKKMFLTPTEPTTDLGCAEPVTA
jgi:hypothetical protein